MLLEQLFEWFSVHNIKDLMMDFTKFKVDDPGLQEVYVLMDTCRNQNVSVFWNEFWTLLVQVLNFKRSKYWILANYSKNLQVGEGYFEEVDIARKVFEYWRQALNDAKESIFYKSFWQLPVMFNLRPSEDDELRYITFLAENGKFGTICNYAMCFQEWPYEKVLELLLLDPSFQAPKRFIEYARKAGIETKDMETTAVNAAIEGKKFEVACALMYTYELQNTYPKLPFLRKQHKIKKACQQGKWFVAAFMTHEKLDLQAIVMDELVEAQEFELANEYGKKFGLQSIYVPFTDAEIQDRNAIMSQKVCDFDVTLNCCILIQSNEHLDLIENEIMGQRLIGLDVEWPPMTGKWSSGESSLLQIGFRNKAYLFDLYALRKSERFGKFLKYLLATEHIIKIGYDFSQDFNALHKLLRNLDYMIDIQNFVELKHCKFTDPTANSSKGLSSMVNHFFGKPLDKRMQTSNWALRPLSAMQIKYAALDAISLVRLVEELEPMQEAGKVQFLAVRLT